MAISSNGIAERTKSSLSILFSILVLLGVGHLLYGDFWGFVLDMLFALLGYITFKRMQLSTIAFFCFLCAFNAGIDLLASINLLASVSRSSADELFTMAQALDMQVWQLVTATAILALDAIVMFACLILSCKVYSELRSNIYSQIGLITEPLMLPGHGRQSSHLAQDPPAHAAFRPFQGRPHRISEPSTPARQTESQ